MQHPKSGAQIEAKKKSYSSPLKKEWIVYVNLIGIWELSYAALSLWSFAVTNGKTHPTLSQKGRSVYDCHAAYVNPAPNATPQVWGTKKKQRKKSYGSNNDCSTV